MRQIRFEDITGKCASCPHKWCGGGCRCTALEQEGDLLGSDLACFWEEKEASNVS